MLDVNVTIAIMNASWITFENIVFEKSGNDGSANLWVIIFKVINLAFKHDLNCLKIYKPINKKPFLIRLYRKPLFVPLQLPGLLESVTRSRNFHY